jgi:hypothetical protein
LADSENFSSIQGQTQNPIQSRKMNPRLGIESLSGTFVPTVPRETEPILDADQTKFETEGEPAGEALPVWRSSWKFEDPFEALIAMLSVVYLTGAIGFGGLLLFYTLCR